MCVCVCVWVSECMCTHMRSTTFCKNTNRRQDKTKIQQKTCLEKTDKYKGGNIAKMISLLVSLWERVVNYIFFSKRPIIELICQRSLNWVWLLLRMKQSVQLYLMSPEHGGHVHLFTNVSLKPDTVLGTPN